MECRSLWPKTQDEDDHGEGRGEQRVDSYAVEMAQKMVERLGHRRILVGNNSRPAILALKEAVRRVTWR